MRFLKKLKSGNFWVSLISAGVLIAEGVFNFEIQTEYLNQILLGLMGILTLFGIVSDHGDKETIIANVNDNLENKNNKDSSKKEENSSAVKSICDTISLLVNKVSISTKEDEIEEACVEEKSKEIEEVKENRTEEKNNVEDKKEQKEDESLKAYHQTNVELIKEVELQGENQASNEDVSVVKNASEVVGTSEQISMIN